MFVFTPWHLLERYIKRVRVFVDHFVRTLIPIMIFSYINEDALDPLCDDILAQMTPLNSK